MGKKLLTIDTLEPDRDFIAINGKPYQLRNPDELSVAEIARIRRLSKTTVGEGLSLDSEEADPEKIEDYANQVLGMIVLELDAETRDKLSTTQKFLIARAFTTASSARRARMEAQTEAPPTTESSSPGSSGSTGAASASG